MKTFIAICGNPVDGFKHFGPFSDHDAALEWCESSSPTESWWVVALEEVK